MTGSQSTSVDVGPGSVTLPWTMPVPGSEFERAGISLFEELYIANYVQINGCKYSSGTVVALAMKCDLLYLDE